MKRARLLLAVLLTSASVLGACGGGEHATCTSNEECANLEVCERNFCKVCEVLCETTASCTEPTSCVEYGNGCRTCN